MKTPVFQEITSLLKQRAKLQESRNGLDTRTQRPGGNEIRQAAESLEVAIQGTKNGIMALVRDDRFTENLHQEIEYLWKMALLGQDRIQGLGNGVGENGRRLNRVDQDITNLVARMSAGIEPLKPLPDLVVEQGAEISTINETVVKLDKSLTETKKALTAARQGFNVHEHHNWPGARPFEQRLDELDKAMSIVDGLIGDIGIQLNDQAATIGSLSKMLTCLPDVVKRLEALESRTPKVKKGK